MMYVIYGVVAGAIILGWIINKFDTKESKIKFVAKEMPHMKPLPMGTDGVGFWKGIKMWLTTTRKWEIAKDWKYTIGEFAYVVPKGFVFDGASVPKFFRSWLSPMGVLLMGGLVHDYGYKYQTLLYASKKGGNGIQTQKSMDETFRDINICVNGFYVLNYLAYYALRLGGFMAWNGHRKTNADWKDGL
jgi:hypothetical protein